MVHMVHNQSARRRRAVLRRSVPEKNPEGCFFRVIGNSLFPAQGPAAFMPEALVRGALGTKAVRENAGLPEGGPVLQGSSLFFKRHANR